jgi:S-adenosyl-L-methionine hydrolase (adenosine-forming)
MALRPVALFTDFGVTGPYCGMMKSAVLAECPDAVMIDMLADAPVFDPRSSAYLLNAMRPYFPLGAVVLAIVDPGVGGSRLPLLVQSGGRSWLGPDNGLFQMILRHDPDARCWRIDWQPPQISATFHGRDLFAPLAGRLARTEVPSRYGVNDAISIHDALGGIPVSPYCPDIGNDWPDDWPAVIYVDPYGNVMTGLRAHALDRKAPLYVNQQPVFYARTFSDVAVGKAFWTVNSIGLVEIACNSGHAAQYFGVTIGSPIIF